MPFVLLPEEEKKFYDFQCGPCGITDDVRCAIRDLLARSVQIIEETLREPLEDEESNEEDE